MEVLVWEGFATAGNATAGGVGNGGCQDWLQN